MYNKACCYGSGTRGFPLDYAKALELWHRAGDLGHACSYYNVGVAYLKGDGVKRDEKKAKHYYELAAMGGDAKARNGLGLLEMLEGNTKRALKHLMIAVGGGSNESLKTIKQFYMKGLATKDDYAKALRAYQAYLDEIRSDQRDEAAAFSEVEYYEL